MPWATAVAYFAAIPCSMHIAVLTHNYPRFPGDFSGSFVAALSQELARQGHRVSVLAPWDAAYTVDGQAGPQASHRPQLYLWRYAPRGDWHRLGYMRTMEADVRMRRETYWLAPAFFAAGVAAALRWCRRHRPDVIHAHWLLPNGFFGAAAGRLLGIPLVVSIPGSDALVAGQNPLFRRMARFALDQAGLVTANSHALQEVAVRDLGADPARFDLIIYGVDPGALRPDPTGTAELRASLGVPADALLLLAVGRMVYKKGFDVLLRSLGVLRQSGLLACSPSPAGPHRLPPIHLALVGDGDLWQAWQALARDLGLEGCVHWVGRVPFDRIPAYYNAADALVMPSVTRPADGLNVCVLDAMACAKPVIGSTAAGNELVIRNGVNGYLIPEQDPAALAGAILRLAALSPEQRQAMGAAGRRLVETEFGWPPLARRYLDHFARLAGQG
ncbi:MAG: glycosyltransferase [Anaerolineae bacterium]|nr:glycosyltransferase [Anaerolineae bacterium]